MRSEVREGIAGGRLVVGLSLASGAVGLVPLPVVADLGIVAVRAILLLLLARRHGVELSHKQALILAGGLEESSSVSRLAALSALVVGLRMAWRKLSRAVLALLRFDDVARTYLLSIYFQYYLVAFRQSDGAAVSDDEIQHIRRVIPMACSTARQHLISALFRKSVSDLIRTGTFLPRTLWQLALSAMEEGQVDHVEQVVEDDVDGFFGRITSAVERELSATGEVSLNALCAAFDAAWEEAPPTPGDRQPGHTVTHGAGDARAADLQERADERDDT